MIGQRSNKALSAEEITNELIQQHPEYKDLSNRALIRRISNILSSFERQEYVKREKYDRRFQSEITLSDQQREGIASLITYINRFKNGDGETIEEGRRFAQSVLNEPHLFSELMLKAKETSPSANRVGREEMNSVLLSILQEHPNSMIGQILQILDKDYDKRLTSSGVRKNLSRLVEEEMIVSEKTKSGNVYRVVEEESQTPSAQN